MVVIVFTSEVVVVLLVYHDVKSVTVSEQDDTAVVIEHLLDVDVNDDMEWVVDVPVRVDLWLLVGLSSWLFSSSLPMSRRVSVKVSTVDMTGSTALTVLARLPTTLAAQLISLAGVFNTFFMSEIKLPLPLVLEHSVGGSDLSGKLL